MPEAVTPDLSVGVEAPETTSPLPPLLGVLKAKVVLPTVRAYHVLVDQEPLLPPHPLPPGRPPPEEDDPVE
ncbi:MAG: hypothetical protein IJQ06_02945 [Paludibacteraceae bacterium]|nr:hypothetical protein [Paludibacteraceae bacterium]